MILSYRAKNTRRALALILALLLAIMNLGASAESVVATKNTRAYRTPDKGSASISVPVGTVLERTASRDGWIQVKRKGVTAYMRAADVDSIVRYDSVTAYTAKSVPMYKAYGKSAKYGAIPAGSALKVTALAGDWAYVSFRGRRGLVAKAALTVDVPKAEPAIDPDITLTNGLTAYVATDGAKVYKSASTSSKVLGKLPLNTKLSVAAVKGDWALVKRSGKYAFLRTGDLSDSKVTVEKEPEKSSNTIQAMDWWTSGIQSIFARGVTATVTDVATGISWKEIRKGGTNHADCQPLTSQDTANLKRAVGGKWSWDRRAVVVTINGQHYAASINCMPHGGGSVTGNNFNGHHCIHFINSRTSGTNKVDSDHQNAIKKALALNNKK